MSAVTGAVRFGSALNLNVHFHLLVLDGVYRREGEGRLRFVPVPAPSTEELKRLVQRIAARIGRSLERSGLITRDIENAYLAFDPGEEAAMLGLLGHSITYRIATGPREGQKVFTLQTLPAEPDAPRREVAESSGFSLHAGIAAKASQRDKLEAIRLADESGKSAAQVSRELGLRANQIVKWRDQLEAKQEGAFPGRGRSADKDAEIRRLQKELTDSREENEFLKKTAVFFARNQP